MRINAHKIGTLFRKDMKDSLQNKNTMIIAALPVLFAVIFDHLYGDLEEAALVYGNMAFYMSVLMMVALMGTTFLSTMVAEEKEKNTLRVLMLANVSAADFIISKVLVNFVYTEVLCTIIAFLTAVPVAHLPVLWGVTALVMASLSLVSICIGILSRDQMSTGLLSSPAALLFLMPPLLADMSETLAQIARYVPTAAMMELYHYATGAELIDAYTGTAKVWNPRMSLAVMAAWIVFAGGLFMITYKKKGIDN